MKPSRNLDERKSETSEKSQWKYISGNPRGRTVADCKNCWNKEDGLIARPLQYFTYKYFLLACPLSDKPQSYSEHLKKIMGCLNIPIIPFSLTCLSKRDNKLGLLPVDKVQIVLSIHIEVITSLVLPVEYRFCSGAETLHTLI